MSNSVEGEITAVNAPVNIAYGYSKLGALTTANNNFVGNTTYRYTLHSDMFERIAVCNSRKDNYFYDPRGAGGTSHEVRVQDLFNTCTSEFPRLLRSFIYFEGRPIAVVHSERASGTDNQTDIATYWIHSDQLGTPILVTNVDGTERWRWENDPYGRTDPVEFTVSEQDVSPDEDSSSGSPPKYNTCCCSTCGVSGCNTSQTTCTAGCCAGSTSQGVVWTKTFTVSGANNLRLHFSQLSVEDGTTRTGKDYVKLKKASGSVISELTGNLGAHWGPWAGEGESTMVVDLLADNVQDTGTRAAWSSTSLSSPPAPTAASS